MNRRLEQFLAAENISQAEFADTIQVARASVSHILAGRNKPGFSFIESMAFHYPTLNIDWILTGRGKMYKDQNSAVPAPIATQTAQPLDSHEEEKPVLELFSPIRTPATEPSKEVLPHIPVISEPVPSSKSISADCSKKTIEKVIIFYSDGTFDEL